MKPLGILLLLIVQSVVAQEINRFDKNNERHGIWKKYFDGTQQLRYEGRFEHGKEVGLFKFYTRKSKDQPVATRLFKDDSKKVEVKFFALSGRLISKGVIVDKKREGTWELFQKDGTTLLSRERYRNGELDGLYEIFYKNGKLSETYQYAIGLKNGISKKYAPNQSVIHEVVYVDGKLRGPATFYDIKGNVIITGEYAADRKAGLWKYYEGDKLIKEVDYKNWNKPVTIEY